MQDHVLLFKAIHALQIDVPVLAYRIVGNRIELHLYGGQVKTWELPAESPTLADAPSSPPKPKAKARRDAQAGRLPPKAKGR